MLAISRQVSLFFLEDGPLVSFLWYKFQTLSHATFMGPWLRLTHHACCQIIASFFLTWLGSPPRAYLLTLFGGSS